MAVRSASASIGAMAARGELPQMRTGLSRSVEKVEQRFLLKFSGRRAWQLRHHDNASWYLHRRQELPTVALQLFGGQRGSLLQHHHSSHHFSMLSIRQSQNDRFQDRSVAIDYAFNF